MRGSNTDHDAERMAVREFCTAVVGTTLSLVAELAGVEGGGGWGVDASVFDSAMVSL